MSQFKLNISMKPLALQVIATAKHRAADLDPDRVHTLEDMLGEALYNAFNSEEMLIAENILQIGTRIDALKEWMYIRDKRGRIYYVNVENGLSPTLLSRMAIVEEC